ncbi:sodium:alanine symporter family protein [Aliidiomarina minuta]|uniref:Sodium:alanine symporter family protein n=1 Tax=Aliidiomarina minuta TaxID=880057 RepID=A0A432W6L8_9GAMM|nr:AGCS family amino acid carrier protein [Aliidiomarina minuta]RUO25723.1 sodium:alanine symporter family protein [Aliidiomarina minuta]
MEFINNTLDFLDSILGGAFYFPFILLGVGLFFTIYLKFPQIRFFKHGWRVVTGKFDRSRDPGDTTHFQALTTALSGTVGTGNIGGVALALFLGGPAALFWMWMTAFFGMTTKFVEVTLSHKYRSKTEDGTMAGGPMYFMDKGLNMKWLAVIFAIATVISSFGTGNMPQSNNIAQAMEATFNVPPVWVGGVMAILLGLVIIGGIRRIAKVTSRIVPLMSVLYVLGAFAVIFYNVENIIPSFVSIFSDAFTGSAAVGGFVGASFAYAFNMGVARGLFSNEAGQGSAAIAHASARTKEPAEEGMVSILEPFIDTIIICTLTGLVILASGVWTEKHQNRFDRSDMRIISGVYSDQIEQDRSQLSTYLNQGRNHDVEVFEGEIEVVSGRPVAGEYTILNSRSVAENVEILIGGDTPYSGTLNVTNGRFTRDNIQVQGESLIHSAALTTVAFTRGYFGDFGQYIVSIGLLMFAFSTAIAWSYYGDRAMIYLAGPRSVMPYRLFYVAGFFIAAVSDTTLIWKIAAVAIVMMTLPNLLGIFLMRKEMKSTVNKYWKENKHKLPDKK